MRVVAGGDVSDTVQAIQRQALVVEVRGQGGEPISDAVVRFSAMPSNDPQHSASMLVCAVESNVFGTFAATKTDASGRASVLVQMGRAAGASAISVEVPEYGFETTAEYEVKPGAAAGFVVNVRDTTLLVGGHYEVGGAVVDRFSNPRPTDGVFYSASSSNVTVTAKGVVTATAVGRGTIVISTLGHSETASVSVLPSGKFAVWTSAYGSIQVVDADGTNRTTLTSVPYGWVFPQWSPAGNSIVFYRADPSSNASLATVSMTGDVRDLVIPSGQNGLRAASWPRFSPDGQWVYFTGVGSDYGVWRVHPNGTGIEEFVPDARRAAVSPDGTRLVYERVSDQRLTIMDIATKTTTVLPVLGELPVFSPDGTRIAYIASTYTPSIINVDGTAARAIATELHEVNAGVSWSPDGNWVLVRSYSTGFTYVNATTGEKMPIGFAQSFYQMVLKP